MFANRIAYRLVSVLMLIPGITHAADKSNEQHGQIAFSIKQWEGEYLTSDSDPSKNTPCRGGIWTADLGTGEVRKVVDVGGMTANPIYSPAGDWLYFQANATGQYEIYRCRPDGTEIQNLTGPQNPKREFESYGFSISSDGSQVLHTIHNGKVAQTAIMNADGTDRHPIEVKGVDYFYMGALSPDKRSMASANVKTDYTLMLVELATGQSRILEKGTAQARCIGPQFSADGRALLFLKTDGDLYSINTDGTERRQLTQGNKYNTFYLSPKDEHGSTDPPSFSPDNKRIALVAFQDGVPQVFTMNHDGSGRRQITSRKTACGRVKWSPDGQLLTFVSFEGQYPQLFVVNADGGEPRKLTDVPFAVYLLNWRPNVR